MAQIVQPQALESRTLADGPPGLVDVPEVRPRLPAGYDPGAVVGAKEACEELDRLRRQRDGPRARLGIGQPQLARFERHVFAAQPEDLAPAAPGKRQEPDRRHRGRGRGRAAPGLRLVEGLSQAGELRIRQEPLPPALGVFHNGAAGI